ncbi:MAG: hypothetical protein GSR86_05310, partial [Desulfurococcales archaeon]|nr:hypothetical protein [Desulfurococcales archaeon]
SIFTDNIIDILADNASIEFIDTFARRVISYLTTIKIYHYSVDPYKMIAQAMDILRERDTRKKREKFKKLLKTIMQYATYVTTLYELIDMIKNILN